MASSDPSELWDPGARMGLSLVPVGGGAFRAGLRAGDMIARWDGKELARRSVPASTTCCNTQPHIRTVCDDRLNLPSPCGEVQASGLLASCSWIAVSD